MSEHPAATFDQIICQVCGEYIEGGYDAAVELSESGDVAHDDHSASELQSWKEANLAM